MCRFASEVGVRGDMLREFRFKWAQEEMELSDLYDKLNQMLNQIRDEDRLLEFQENTKDVNTGQGADVEDGEGKLQAKVVLIPQRKGKMKYKIYGLDLSDPKWGEVAYRIHETEKLITLAEPKEITGKCKVVAEKISYLNVEDDLLPLLGEWQELLQLKMVDWIALLDRLKERSLGLYFKVAEMALSEESFQTNIRDYSKLIYAHAKDNRIDDVERILKKMSEKGIQPDILTSIISLHMYSKAGNLDLTKAAFESLRSHGFQPDMKAYMSMIMAYVNAGQTKLGESLLREMGKKDHGVLFVKKVLRRIIAYSVDDGESSNGGLTGYIAWKMMVDGDYQVAIKLVIDFRVSGLKLEVYSCLIAMTTVVKEPNEFSKALRKLKSFTKAGLLAELDVELVKHMVHHRTQVMASPTTPLVNDYITLKEEDDDDASRRFVGYPQLGGPPTYPRGQQSY